MIPFIVFVLTVFASNQIQNHPNLIPSLMLLSCNNDPSLILKIRTDASDSINSTDKALDILAGFCLKTFSNYIDHDAVKEELINLVYIENIHFNSLLMKSVLNADSGNSRIVSDYSIEFDPDTFGEILLGRELGIFSLFIEYSWGPLIKRLIGKMLSRGPKRISQIISNFKTLKGVPNSEPLALFLLKCLLGQQHLINGRFFTDNYVAYFRQIELFVMRITGIALPENWIFHPIRVLRRLQFDLVEDATHAIAKDYMNLSLPDLIKAPKSISSAIFYLGVILFKYVSNQLNSRDLNVSYFFNPFSHHIRQDEFPNKFLSLVITDVIAQDKGMILKHLLDMILKQGTQLISESNRSPNLPLETSIQVMWALQCMHDISLCDSSLDIIADLVRFREFDSALQTLFDQIPENPPISTNLTALLNILLTAAPHRSLQLISFEGFSQILLNNNEVLFKLKLLPPDSYYDIISRCEEQAMLRPSSLDNYLNLIKLPTLKSNSPNLTSECIFYSNYQFYLDFSAAVRPQVYITSKDILESDVSLQVFIKTSLDSFLGGNRRVFPGDTVFILRACDQHPYQFIKLLKFSSQGLVFKYLEHFQGYAFVISSKNM